MLSISRLTKAININYVFALQLIVLITLLITQQVAYALQYESIAMRNMKSFNKFDGLSQSAIVIKSRGNNIKHLDRIEFATGELNNGDENSLFFSVGPTWRFNKRIARNKLAFIEMGTSPTWISNENFKNESLGGNVFFTSNIQVGMHFGYRRKLSLSLRIHHISNGGLNSKNPGTDMVGIELSYPIGQ